MSALMDPFSASRDDLVAEVATLRTALAELARIPGWEVRLMDHPRVVEQVRRCAEAEAEFWAVVEEARPRTLALARALEERCEALSEEFAAAEAAATSDGGWG